MTYKEALIKILAAPFDLKMPAYVNFLSGFRELYHNIHCFFEDPEYAVREIFAEIGGMIFQLFALFMLIVFWVTAPLSALLIKYLYKKEEAHRKKHEEDFFKNVW